MEILGARLKREVRRRVAIGAAVVHVHVHIPAPPAARRQIVQTLESDAVCDTNTRRHVHVGTKDVILRSTPHLDVYSSAWYRELGRAVRVEVRILELPLSAVKGLVGMPPGVVGRIASAFGRGHGDPRRQRPTRAVHDVQPQGAHRLAVPSLGATE